MIKYLGHEIEWVPIIDKNKKSLYLQISNCIEEDIKSGKLPTGFKLPSQRLIANYLNINHSTVTKAYNFCENKGLIHGITGKGTFVSNTHGEVKSVLSDAREHLIDMAMLHPLYETNDTLHNMIEELSLHFDRDLMYRYTSASGHYKHKVIASKWLKNLSIYAQPERMLITAGSQNALFCILLTVFKRGDSIAVDELTYPGLRNTANQLGINLVSIMSDDKGMDPGELERAIKKNYIKGVYLIPDCHNPTTTIMDASRRRVVANLVEENDLIVIEDSLFRFTCELQLPTMYSLLPNNCYLIVGLSKLLNPGFRIAYLLIPESTDFKSLENTLHNQVFMPSSFTGEIVSSLQSSKKLMELLQIRRRILVKRNEMFNSIFNIEEQKISFPLFRFIELEHEIYSNMDLEQFFNERGVRIYSADRFRVKEGGKIGLRISIASAESEKDYKYHLQVLYSIYQELLSLRE